VSDAPAAEVIALDDALTALAAFDARKSRVVELRFFGGLTVEETAEALHVSPITVMRDWSLARAWLAREISRAPTLAAAPRRLPPQRAQTARRGPRLGRAVEDRSARTRGTHDT
jgi:hypothetical protein